MIMWAALTEDFFPNVKSEVHSPKWKTCKDIIFWCPRVFMQRKPQLLLDAGSVRYAMRYGDQMKMNNRLYSIADARTSTYVRLCVSECSKISGPKAATVLTVQPLPRAPELYI